jgi:8-oxo-dGTP pyrophosphatase MutT (NUDIX family)
MEKANTELFIHWLKTRLTQALPGNTGHSKMEPVTRKQFLLDYKHATGPRKSAVMVLLFERENALHTFFIERNIYEGVHSGQISFPGGGFEQADIDLVATALRETEEEIGIKATDIQVLGCLTDLYIPPSNFDVMPVVGYLSKAPMLQIDTSEVQQVFDVAIKELLDEKNKGKGEITARDGSKVEVPCFRFQHHMVWGATSMILSEFIYIIKD